MTWRRRRFLEKLIRLRRAFRMSPRYHQPMTNGRGILTGFGCTETFHTSTIIENSLATILVRLPPVGACVPMATRRTMRDWGIGAACLVAASCLASGCLAPVHWHITVCPDAFRDADAAVKVDLGKKEPETVLEIE